MSLVYLVKIGEQVFRQSGVYLPTCHRCRRSAQVTNHGVALCGQHGMEEAVNAQVWLPVFRLWRGLCSVAGCQSYPRRGWDHCQPHAVQSFRGAVRLGHVAGFQDVRIEERIDSPAGLITLVRIREELTQ